MCAKAGPTTSDDGHLEDIWMKRIVFFAAALLVAPLLADEETVMAAGVGSTYR